MAEPFRLNLAVAAWRRGLARSVALSAEQLAELEGHLVESIERRVESGASPEAAFAGAVEALGSEARLIDEFAMAASPPRRALHHTQEFAMKYALPASIAFAALLLAFSPARQEGPNYQIAGGSNGEVWRMDTRSGEVCRILQWPSSGNATVDSCVGAPEMLADPDLVRIVGRVYQDGGSIGAPGARVTVGSQGAVTDRRGRFEIFTDRTGPTTLHAMFESLEVERAIDLQAGQYLTVDLELPVPPGGIPYVVRAWSNGKNAPGVLVSVGDARGLTDNNGEFRTSLPGPGTYAVWARFDGYPALEKIHEVTSSAGNASAYFSLVGDNTYVE